MIKFKEVKPKLKIPGYKVFYADKRTGAKVLVSEKHGLSGKPDYILKRGRKLIPVELKSARLNGGGPRERDVMQLAVYFLIIQDVYGLKPRRGRLLYADTMFVVKNTRRLRKKLLAVLSEMRDALEYGIKDEVRREYIKCKSCICRETVCEAD